MVLLTVKKNIISFFATLNELTCLVPAITGASSYAEKEGKLFAKALFTAYYNW